MHVQESFRNRSCSTFRRTDTIWSWPKSTAAWCKFAQKTSTTTWYRFRFCVGHRVGCCSCSLLIDDQVSGPVVYVSLLRENPPKVCRFVVFCCADCCVQLIVR